MAPPFNVAGRGKTLSPFRRAPVDHRLRCTSVSR